MNKFMLKKIIAVSLAAISVSALNILNADAAWVKDSNGWWNTEGNSWSVGWRLIDNKWYYFDSQGYMKIGWILDGGKWYYLNTDGSMAKNTSIDGYKIGADGAWIENNEGVKDITIDEIISSLKDKGYNPHIKDAKKGFLEGTRKIINIGDEKLEVYAYSNNDEMEKDADLICLGGFAYKHKDLMWDSYPHFYKKSNLIIQYIGKNYETLCTLNNIIGDQFIGMDISSKLSESDDLRSIAYGYLSDEQKKNLNNGWKSAQISRLKDINDKGVEVEEYIVDFRNKNDLCGGPIIYLDVNSFDFLGFGLLD